MSEEDLQVHCNECGGVRVQHVRSVVRVPRTDEIADGYFTSEEATYRTLQCGGCETVTLREDYWFSEWEAGTTTYYPPHVTRKLPPWAWRLRPITNGDSPSQYMFGVLKQIYDAIAVEAYALAAMGVRALLEHVMVTTVSDKGTFARNLRALADAGHVTERERVRLEQVLDVGNAAIHRAYLPDKGDVFTSLDIAEHVVASLYIHDQAIAGVSGRVPKRS